jgi:hypothetical protein
MSKYSGNKHSKGSKKRRVENQYDLQTILDEDASNDGEDLVEPRAAARNAETADEGVNFAMIFNFWKFSYKQFVISGR